jgi:RNase P/RNase MRP subunit p29
MDKTLEVTLRILGTLKLIAEEHVRIYSEFSGRKTIARHMGESSVGMRGLMSEETMGRVVEDRKSYAAPKKVVTIRRGREGVVYSG